MLGVATEFGLSGWNQISGDTFTAPNTGLYGIDYEQQNDLADTTDVLSFVVNGTPVSRAQWNGTAMGNGLWFKVSTLFQLSAGDTLFLQYNNNAAPLSGLATIQSCNIRIMKLQ